MRETAIASRFIRTPLRIGKIRAGDVLYGVYLSIYYLDEHPRVVPQKGVPFPN